jgi:hypothetical protein
MAQAKRNARGVTRKSVLQHRCQARNGFHGFIRIKKVALQSVLFREMRGDAFRFGFFVAAGWN